MNKAPWADFEGNYLFEGDIIIHPSGESGIIVFDKKFKCCDAMWFVDYGGGDFSQLCLQIGDKGQARKFNRHLTNL